MLSSSTFTEVILLTSFAAIALGISLLVAGRRWRARHDAKVNFIVFLGLLALAGLTALITSPDLALAPLGLAGFWLFSCVGRSSVALTLLGRIWAISANHYAQAGLLILVGFGSLLGWSAWQDAQTPMWSENQLKLDAGPPEKVLAQPALTDRGNPIPLRVHEDEVAPCSIETEQQCLTEAGLPFKLIRTGAASLDSNCHGWTFTGGKYWVLSDDVERILQDNGYLPVREPRPGDVIVYRTGNQIRHTGVVTVVTPDGTVLVESKWGRMGRFLHRPEDQTYSRDWQFYRSARPGHRLRNLPDATPTVPTGGHST